MRQIDNKYITSGNITKVDGTPIPEDEPLFLFRAQDRLVPDVLKYYMQLRQKIGSSRERLELLQAQIDVIQTWQSGHPTRIRTPE